MPPGGFEEKAHMEETALTRVEIVLEVHANVPQRARLDAEGPRLRRELRARSAQRAPEPRRADHSGGPAPGADGDEPRAAPEPVEGWGVGARGPQRGLARVRPLALRLAAAASASAVALVVQVRHVAAENARRDVHDDAVDAVVAKEHTRRLARLHDLQHALLLRWPRGAFRQRAPQRAR